MLDSIQPYHQKELKQFAVPKKRKSHFRLWLAVTMLLLLGAGIFIGSKFVIYAQRILDSADGKFSFRQLFIAGDKKLIGEEDREIRFLLLGIGGENHEGANLTDTIILATLKLPENNNEKPSVSMISIPRDLVVNIPGYDYKKINSAYAFGQSGNKNAGPVLTTKTIENVMGVDIPYYAVVDFEGFKKAIDHLGGIEINVDKTFTDSQYPDEKKGYLAPVTFKEGKQKINGQTALQYVRSRHGNNGEGTDFARSKRQQKVIKAVRDKILSAKILTNLNLIDKLLSDFSDHTRTNMAPWEMKRIYDLTRSLDDQQITSTAIDVESGLVCNKIDEVTGAYILLPCRGFGKYDDIQNLAHNQFQIGDLQKENPSIELQNASGLDYLNLVIRNRIELKNNKITTATFKGETKYTESIIYDNTKGEKKSTLKYLEKLLGIKVAGGPYPLATSSKNPDFVIVISSDLKNKIQ